MIQHYLQSNQVILHQIQVFQHTIQSSQHLTIFQALNPTPVITYSAHHPTTESIPNDIFKRIRTDIMFVWTSITSASSNMDNTFGCFDIICKLIFGVFLNVIVCLFGLVLHDLILNYVVYLLLLEMKCTLFAKCCQFIVTCSLLCLDLDLDLIKRD